MPSNFATLRAFEVNEPELVLRRYMSVEKFHSLLASRALYFSPASKFGDEKEGHATNFDHWVWDEQLVSVGFSGSLRERARQAKLSVTNHNRKAVVISCWTKRLDDCRRMWTEYGGGFDSVVVETNLRRLRECVGPGFLFIPVRYVDFNKFAFPKDHSLKYFFFKRLEYEWEHEIRIIGHLEPGQRVGSPRLVGVNLELLLQRILISTNASFKFVESIHAMTADACPTVRVEELV